MRGMVAVYNETIARLPGVAEIDMARIERAMGQVGDTAQDELKPALVATAEATDDLTVSTGEFTAAAIEAESAAMAEAAAVEEAAVAQGRLRDATLSASQYLRQFKRTATKARYVLRS